MNEIEEIKARLDIVDVVGQYVPLQKAGRSFKAPCPFHTERTPSFIVSPDRQSWHCFGACGTGGDVISFVMRKEGLDFADALRILAERAGVKLRERRASEHEDRQRERVYAANEATAQFFRNLLEDEEPGRQARDYLARRGVDAKTAAAFSLGWSAPAWESLREHLSHKGFTDTELLAAGLLVEGESRLHDRFRGRLMFPIRDVKGRIIGFGARALDDSLPKYINTSQTTVFDKGGVLYALDRAQDGIRREGRAVLVEGYMDVIAAHQHGFDNVVASMGTSLTERQVRLLKRLTGEIVLALDADAAGNEAAIRGHDVVREALRESAGATPVVSWRGLVGYQESASVELRVAVLPEGRDPDEVIRADPDLWRALIDGATPVLDHRLDAAARAHDLSNPRGRSAFVQEFLPLLTSVIDPVVRAHYVQRMSRLAQVSEDELNRMLARSRPHRQGARQEIAEKRLAPVQSDPREEFFLALLLQHPQFREEGLNTPPELLWQSENRQVLVAWQQFDELEAVKAALPVELLPYVERLILRKLPSFAPTEALEAFLDCRKGLETRQVKAEKQATAALLAELQEELGPVALVEALSAGEDDQQTKEVAGLQLLDMETGLRLHSKERSHGANAVETRNNG